MDVHIVTSGNLNDRNYLRLLKLSSVVITMSKFKEGWCRTAHEAMLCKTPVIGSGKGGMKELLALGGQIICKDFEFLKENVELFLSNTKGREIVGQNGYNFTKDFTLDRFKKSWSKLIKELT